jgi:hypothetical protein
MNKLTRLQALVVFLFATVVAASLVALPTTQFGWEGVSAQYAPPKFGPDPGPVVGLSGVDANGNPIADVIFPGQGTIFVGGTRVIVEVFARQLPPFYVGSQSVIDIPYVRGADVFAYYRSNVVRQFFADALTVCVKGEGRLLFAAASQQPRVFIPIDTAPSRWKGFLCAYVGQPGTLALVAK